jgi:hypothetical protein
MSRDVRLYPLIGIDKTVPYKTVPVDSEIKKDIRDWFG